MNKLIDEYVELVKLEEETKIRISEIRNIFENTLEQEYKDERVNIYFKESKIFEFTDKIKELAKKQKEEMELAKSKEIETGKAKLSKIKRILNVIVYGK